MALFSHPIIAMARTIHSSSALEKCRRSSRRSSSWIVAGTVERARATRTAARSASGRALPSSAEATCSTVAPRRRANVQAWAEQQAHPALRLATYMARPTVERGAPSPQISKGRLRKFGTITLYERKAVGQISRYGSQLGTTPRSVSTSSSTAPYRVLSVENGTASFCRRETSTGACEGSTIGRGV
jgi:hypothetical protein